MTTAKPPDRSTAAADTDGLGPVTAGEVRTKLELARQFLDMGDPESARHMLDEVLAEGNAEQRQEAQQLIDTLP
jgi:pilus assembly protein FimV